MKKTFFLFGLFITTLCSHAQIYWKDIPRQSDKFSQEQNLFIKELQIAYNDWMTEQNYFWQTPRPPSFGTGVSSWAEADRNEQLRQAYERQRQIVYMKGTKYKNLLELYRIKYTTTDTTKSKKEPINKHKKVHKVKK